MAEAPFFPDPGALLHVSYEAVRFPAPVSSMVAFLISPWNLAFGFTVLLTVCHRTLGPQPVLAFQWVFLASPAFDLKWETPTSFPLHSQRPSEGY